VVRGAWCVVPGGWRRLNLNPLSHLKQIAEKLKKERWTVLEDWIITYEAPNGWTGAYMLKKLCAQLEDEGNGWIDVPDFVGGFVKRDGFPELSINQQFGFGTDFDVHGFGAFSFDDLIALVSTEAAVKLLEAADAPTDEEDLDINIPQAPEVSATC